MNMKPFKSLLILLLLLALFIGSAIASDNGGAFIENGIGARATGMGLSNVSIANNSEAVYWNPAALVRVKTIDLFSMSTFAFETNYQSFMVALPVMGCNIGIGYIGAQTIGVAETTPMIGHTDRFVETGKDLNNKNSALYVAAGFNLLSNLSVGATGKYIIEELTSYKAAGFGVDTGLLYRPMDCLSLGVNVQNIIKPSLDWNSPSGNIDTAPLNIKTGLGLTLLDNSLTIASDVDYRKNRPLRYHAGIEYKPLPMLPIRAGWNDGNISLGVGLVINPLVLDFAWTSPEVNEIADTYAFSLGVKL